MPFLPSRLGMKVLPGMGIVMMIGAFKGEIDGCAPASKSVVSADVASSRIALVINNKNSLIILIYYSLQFF